MSFAAPQFLTLLLGLPFLGFYLIFIKKRPHLLFNLKPEHKTKVNAFNFIFAARSVLICIILALLILALARPQWPSFKQKTTIENIDLVLVQDTSGSMRAEDFLPNRMEVSKETLKNFVLKRGDDRMGYVVFGTYAALKAPLTYDHQMILRLIDQTQTGMAGDGTAIGMALISALNRLRYSDAKSRIIILVTDGENNMGEVGPLEAAGLAKQMGVKIYTIGIGKSSGAPVPIMMNGRKQYLYNPNGSLYLSYLNPKDLITMSQMTGARSYLAETKQDFNRVLSEINALEKIKREKIQNVLWQEKPFVFLLGALILLALQLLP
jgi:Ca-activated chloride channel family protein